MFSAELICHYNKCWNNNTALLICGLQTRLLTWNVCSNCWTQVQTACVCNLDAEKVNEENFWQTQSKSSKLPVDKKKRNEKVCKWNSAGPTGTYEIFGKKVSRLVFCLPRDDFPPWISVWECAPFSLCVFKFPKYCLFLLSRQPDHSEFSVRSQTCPHGFPLGLVVLTLPGTPEEGWERMREQSHRCWNGSGGGHRRISCPLLQSQGTVWSWN